MFLRWPGLSPSREDFIFKSCCDFLKKTSYTVRCRENWKKERILDEGKYTC
jgi:hypothetical protein